MSYRPAEWIITIQVIVTVACLLATCAAIISDPPNANRRLMSLPMNDRRIPIVIRIEPPLT